MAGRGTGRPTILVTNDDGVHSPGLRLLYEAASTLGRVIVLAPETPKSASGLGITLHKPLRLTRLRLWGGVEVYVTNGTPSDIVYMALEELTDHIDIVLSGVNLGDNTSIQVILSSGTIGAAAQAALLGIPAIAYSIAIDEPEQLEADRETWRQAKRIITVTARHTLQHGGLPPPIDILSINMPEKLTPNTPVKIAPAARAKYMQKITRGRDPRGKPLYWLYGKQLKPQPGTDVYTVHVEKAVAITPLRLDLNTTPTPDTQKWLQELARRLGGATC